MELWRRKNKVDRQAPALAGGRGRAEVGLHDRPFSRWNMSIKTAAMEFLVGRLDVFLRLRFARADNADLLTAVVPAFCTEVFVAAA